ncbi:MAG: hypothetical protein CMH24_00055 [Nitrosomonadales bacterium]|nr:hypothetical protein [Nitrosomonadales bacterium]
MENKNYINLFIIFFSLIIFITKWYYSFFYFDEKIESKIIFESISDGFYNFAPFKAFVDLNLNNSFNSLIDNLGTVTIPIGAYLVHFIFYKVLGTYSFIFLEFFFILVFIIIFYKISRLLNLNRIQSLAVAIILFNIPNIFQVSNLYTLNYFTVIYSEFYTLRFPRPLVTNILFFLFILLILKSEKKDFFIKKNSFIFGIIASLLFTSYFHAFFLQQIVLIAFVIFKFKSKTIYILKKKFKFILIYSLTFFIISLPFLINMIYADYDFLERNGVVDFDLEKKLILAEHLFLKLFKLQFLFIFFLSTFFIFLINKNKNFFYLKKLNLLFIIFYSSIVSPFLFILISPRFFSHFYHFNNLVLISAFILFFYASILFLDYFIKNKIINNLSLLFILILLIGNIYVSSNNYKLINLNNERFTERNEFNEIINIIEKKNILKSKEIGLLTFDNRFLVWATLSEIKYLSIINGVMVSRSNHMIENDLINTFKYLNLSKNDFKNFIRNKKLSPWRYRNDSVKDLFWMRYQANAMVTHNNSKNFDKEVLDFINKSSPLLSQQLIMPNEEFERLMLKYDLDNFSSFVVPDIIVIDKRDEILKKSIIDNKNFCRAFYGKIYTFYYNNKFNINCSNN